MSALLFLLRRNIINYIKDMLRKKSSLVLLIALAGIAAIMIFANSHIETEGVRNLDVFGAFLIGLFLMIFLMSLSQGIKKGAAIFTMADVNLLFPSPVDPRKTLIYGIAKQTGILILASVAMLAQHTNLKSNFGVGGQALGGLMIAYVLLGVLSNLVCVNVYAVCATNPSLRKRAETGVKLTAVALVAGMIFYYMRFGTDFLNTLRGFLGSNAWNYVPIVGWARAITIYASEGNWLMAGVYIILMLLGCGACILWLAKSSADYYEDVISATEIAHAAKDAAKSGKFVTSSTVSKRAKRELGPIKGKGASAFFFRAMREEKRKGFFILSLTTLAAVGAPFAGKMMSGIDDIGSALLWVTLIFAAYLLLFLSLTSNVNKELTQHYLFVAPSSAFAKLVAISAPQLIKFAADALVFFAVTLLLVGTPVTETAGAALVYFTIGMIFTAGQLLVDKLLQNMKAKILIMTLYMLILVVVAAPGLILGMTISLAVSVELGYLAAAVWNTLASAVMVLFCRNLLHEVG